MVMLDQREKGRTDLEIKAVARQIGLGEEILEALEDPRGSWRVRKYVCLNPECNAILEHCIPVGGGDGCASCQSHDLKVMITDVEEEIYRGYERRKAERLAG